MQLSVVFCGEMCARTCEMCAEWILLLKKPCHRGGFLPVTTYVVISHPAPVSFLYSLMHRIDRSIDGCISTDGQIHNLSDSNQYDFGKIIRTILAPSSPGLRCCTYLFPSLRFQLSVSALFPIMETHSALSHSFFCSLNNLYIQVSHISLLPPFLFFPPHLSVSTSPSVPSQRLPL